MQGVFITFEGPEGAGKTTQLQMLAERLRQNSITLQLVREPGGTALGEKIRELLLDSEQVITGTAEVYLYAAARAQLVDEVIRPCLEGGQVVLCDRYVDASIAYQGYGRKLEPELVGLTNTLAIRGIWPDLTILLDIEPEKGLERACKRSNCLDRIELEDLDFHRAVRQGYLTQAELNPERFMVIEAEKPAEELQELIFTRVAKLLFDAGYLLLDKF